MPIEYEAKALGVDRKKVTDLLNSLATVVPPRTLQRRYVYDIVPGDASTWMRLRQTHAGATLSIKRIDHDGIDGTHEWEVTVGDFDTTDVMLRMLGYTPKAYQENYRTTWENRRCAVRAGRVAEDPALPGDRRRGRRLGP